MESSTLTVLYYKRSSKVHKTGKEDGWLTINAGSQVTLRDSPPDSNSGPNNNGVSSSAFNAGAAVAGGKRSALSQSDSEDEEQEYTSKKAKWNAIRKSVMSSKGKNKNKSLGSFTGGGGSVIGGGHKGVIYSGINREIAKQASAGSISEDDILVVGPWECQVISVDDGTSACNGSSISKKHMTMKPAAKPLMKSTLVRKNPISAGLQKKPLVGAKRPLSTAAQSSGRVEQLSGGKAAKASTTTTSASSGKMKKDKNGEWFLDQTDDSSESEDEIKPASKPLLKRGPLKSLKSTLTNKSGRGVGLVKSSTLAKSSVNAANTPTSSANNGFPGAIGNVNVPPSVQKVLRPHQREGIAFLWNCVTGVNEGIKRVYGETGNSGIDSADEGLNGTIRDAPRGAVLADEMGLGKTLMTISTIYALHRQARTNRFIVVCPSSLVSNWAKEFDKWIGKASNPKRVVVRNGSEEGIRSLKSFVMSLQPEVLILSYELLRLHVKIVSKANRIGLLVVDEGHRLKNTSGSQTLSALNSLNVDARVLITGTPIQNNLGEFYNVANFALPGILGGLNAFRRTYERPMSAANKKNATREEKERGRVQSKALEQITKTFVLRRLQKDVLKSLLPPRMELLLFCRPSHKQRELYHGISDRAVKSIGSAGGRDENPLMLLTELRKLCAHPLLLEEESSGNDDSVALSGKLVVLSGLIDSIRTHHPSDKVVIISNFTSALSVIESSILRKKNLPYVRLDGTVELSARQPMVDSFNNGSVNHSFAFLLSSKAGGCGLNLIGANRLIMVDADWNPATDHQAMARVYRQGQKKPCFIYRMFTAGTVEEVIFQRQTQKGNLAQLANDGGKSKSSSSFTPEELRDCFTLTDTQCDTKEKLAGKWSAYSGVSSLLSQDCTDQPLLSICENLKDTLSFVKVVDEEQNIDYASESSDEASLEDDFCDEAELAYPGEDDEEEDPSSEEEFDE